MLFDESRICAPVWCREVTGSEGAAVLGGAPLTVVLASSGRAAAQAEGSEDVLWLSAGSLLLCAGAVTLTPATDCHLLAVGLAGQAAEAAAQALGAPLVSSCSICPLAAQEMESLARAMGADAREQSETALPAQLAYRVLCAVAQADEGASGPELPPLVAEAVLAIRENYAGLYGVEELSAQLGVSKSHLVRVFSAEMGMGPGQYLIAVRISAAQLLLAQRDYPLEVVASLCGFSGANYLCKAFRKHTGTTPAAWRQAHRGRPSPAGRLSALEGALYI